MKRTLWFVGAVLVYAGAMYGFHAMMWLLEEYDDSLFYE